MPAPAAEQSLEDAAAAALAMASAAAAESGVVVTFRSVREALMAEYGRRLEPAEMKRANRVLTALIHAQRGAGAGALAPAAGAAGGGGEGKGKTVLMFTAFSSNYAAGHVCATINAAYAARHGYGWRQEVLPYELMLDAIAPRGHCSWCAPAPPPPHTCAMALSFPAGAAAECCCLHPRYKVHLINRLLADPTVWARHSHILWVDADAVVIAPDSPLGPLLALGALPAGGSSRCLAARALQPRPHGRLTAELPFGRAGRPI